MQVVDRDGTDVDAHPTAGRQGGSIGFKQGLLSTPTRGSDQLDGDGAPLRYLSTTGVDSGGLTSTTEDSQEEGKRRLHNPLRPEAMSHQ